MLAAVYHGPEDLRVEQIPVPQGGWPTSADVQRFLTIVSDRERIPVLVHCEQGVRRTAMMVAAYQMSCLHFTKDQAIDAILPFGRRPKAVSHIRRFIDGYDPAQRVIRYEGEDAAPAAQGSPQGGAQTATPSDRRIANNE